jgi:hypothetical protein
MRGSSNTRLAPLAFWAAAVSVAIAAVGSSTLLFPGPDIGEPPSTPVGRDIVDRVVTPVFGPSPARERASESSPEAPVPTASVPATTLVTIPTGVTQERPARSREGGVTTRRPGGDESPAARDDDGKGKSKAKGKGKLAKASKGEPPYGKAIAGAKSQGHAYGHLKSTTSRGPKQPHVQPAKGHGKAKGHARAHARAGR